MRLLRLSELGAAAAFLWEATRGSRLRPWQSPYLRWRIETYSGTPAESIDRAAFFAFCRRQARPLLRYLAWAARMRAKRRGASAGH